MENNGKDQVPLKLGVTLQAQQQCSPGAALPLLRACAGARRGVVHDEVGPRDRKSTLLPGIELGPNPNPYEKPLGLFRGF